MTRSAQWSTATAVVIVLLFVAAWFLLISPKRSAVAAVREQAVSQDATNRQLEQKITLLKAQAKDLPRQRARLKVLGTQLPPAPHLPTLIRELDQKAKASGVVLVTLNPEAPKSREAATAAGGATLAKPVAQPGGGPYLQEIRMQIEVTGEFAEIQDFLSRIEDLKRVMLTTNVTVEADPGKSVGNSPVFGPRIKDSRLNDVDDLKMTLTSRVFIATAGAPAAATGPGAAPAPAPAPQEPGETPVAQ